MFTFLFIKGFIIGFSIAALIGPIAILCIRRCIVKGPLSGFVSGIGAATADAIYTSTAAFGLTFISSFMIKQQRLLQATGMIFLFYLGIKTFFEKPVIARITLKTDPKNLLGDFVSTFFLTLANPLTIISFAAVFAGLGLGNSHGSYIAASMLVLGVFSGGILWWFLLSRTILLFRSKVNARLLSQINKISGVIIIGFALAILVNIIKNILLQNCY